VSADPTGWFWMSAKLADGRCVAAGCTNQAGWEFPTKDSEGKPAWWKVCDRHVQAAQTLDIQGIRRLP
jgi:hypothetical protein